MLYLANNLQFVGCELVNMVTRFVSVSCLPI
jgi:hypothetical protein